MQLEHRPTKLLIVGASGTGKTTFLCQWLYGSTYSRRFVFDHQGELQLSERLNIAPCRDKVSIVRAVADNAPWILYDCADDYPGDTAAAFDFFCDFAFSVSQAEPGRKVLVSDEVQGLISTDTLSFPFACVLETGRRAGLDCALISQAANLTNNRIRNNLTELVAFRSVDANALKFVQLCGLDADVVAALPAGSFLGRSLLTGKNYSGKVF
jgi:hypothetical protein